MGKSSKKNDKKGKSRKDKKAKKHSSSSSSSAEVAEDPEDIKNTVAVASTFGVIPGFLTRPNIFRRGHHGGLDEGLF